MNTVVVGVDGSESARIALDFAADEAALRGARLLILCAWEVPPAAYSGGFAPPLDPSIVDGLGQGAQNLVNEAVAAARKRQPTVEVEGRATQGQPAQILLEETRNATLVVVGNRGRGGFSSLLLGSVSHQVVQHAGCPVVGGSRCCLGRRRRLTSWRRSTAWRMMNG